MQRRPEGCAPTAIRFARLCKSGAWVVPPCTTCCAVRMIHLPRFNENCRFSNRLSDSQPLTTSRLAITMAMPIPEHDQFDQGLSNWGVCIVRRILVSATPASGRLAGAVSASTPGRLCPAARSPKSSIKEMRSPFHRPDPAHDSDNRWASRGDGPKTQRVRAVPAGAIPTRARRMVGESRPLTVRRQIFRRRSHPFPSRERPPGFSRPRQSAASNSVPARQRPVAMAYAGAEKPPVFAPGSKTR